MDSSLDRGGFGEKGVVGPDTEFEDATPYIGGCLLRSPFTTQYNLLDALE